MEVILMERISKLGKMGDVVKVRPGYARNYLLPQKKAVRSTEQNRKQFEADRARLEEVNKERRSAAEAQAGDMAGLAINLIRQAGESGQLYGSVTARDIADAISDKGFAIGRQQVELTQPIKSLGVYSVAVALHPEVSEDVSVNVARSMEEAEIQARSGRAVLGMEAEEQAAEAAIEELLDEGAAEQVLEDIRSEEEPEATES
ncbi:MAG: 50S ribosomal protein L9 [Rhodospirillales bacterium]|nr:50S ribosomal protein L9 [Rhodospirillales bacterium]